jgi:hypothetical protein
MRAVTDKAAADLGAVLPWGRSAEEYVSLFALKEEDLSGRILDCGAGPSCFTAEVAAKGGDVLACDPLYRFTAGEVEMRVEETAPEILRRVETNRGDFVWTHFRSPEHLCDVRLGAMKRFLADLLRGRTEGRYVAGALPHLPFSDESFDMALVSHLLFLYSDELSLEFHHASLRELLRVAIEVRVFPLLEMSREISPHLGPLTERLESEGCCVEMKRVGYEFFRGADTMLRVTRS